MEDKKLRILIRNIKRSNKLSYDEINYLVEYVNEIRYGSRLNDFYDFEFLNAIMLLISNGEIIVKEGQNIKEVLNKIIDEVKFYLPLGDKTDNYEDVKAMIIASDGYLDKELYALFDNKLDYQQVINILNRSGLNDSTKSIVRKYILTIGGLCHTADEVKREFLSFVNGCQNEHGDINDYFNSRVMDVKKKYGIYDIDERKFANLDGKVREVQDSINTYDRLRKSTIDYEQKVDAMMNQALSSIDSKTKDSVRIIDESIDKVKKDYYDELGRYVLDLKETIKSDSDEAFRKVVDEASEKIREIRRIMNELTSSANKDIIRLQSMADEKIADLEGFLRDEPELQRVLSEIINSKGSREVIIAQSTANVIQKNNSSSVEQTPSVITNPQVIVQEQPTSFANCGIIIPEVDEIILPSKSREILPAFDEKIPFEERYEKVLREKEKREKNGEIYHEIIPQLITCIMEGDFVYLWGPSGSGKSYAIEQASSLLGLDMIENVKITDVYSITGYYDPRGQFVPTPTFSALYNGKLLNNDELDNGNTDTHILLNGIQSKLSKAIRNPQKEYYVTFGSHIRVPVNPNFRMVATGNTNCKGEDEIYSSRGRIDESLQDRFTPKLVLYDNRVEKIILADAPGWYKLFCDFREACLSYSSGIGYDFAPGVGTTRDADDISRYLSHNSKSVNQIIEEKFIQTKDVHYLKYIRDYIKKMYNLPDIENDPNAQKTSGLNKLIEKDIASSLVYGCDQAILRLERKK